MKSVDKNDLFAVLSDWNPWRQGLRTGTERTSYLERMSLLMETNQILVVTGPRRAGKSFLMRQYAARLIRSGVAVSRILMVNLEDPRLGKLTAESLESIYRTYLEFLNPAGKPFIFFDEIQEVEGWEKWVMTMHDLGKARFVVSGSNAKLLSKELGTLLTGRHVTLPVYPLSYAELEVFQNGGQKGGEDDEMHRSRRLREALEWGGFPEVFQTPLDAKKTLLLQYFDDVLNKDLIRRQKIRKAESLRGLARYYFTNIACPITFNAVERFLKITAGTAEKFSSYFEDAYLFFFLKRFSFKVKEQEKSPRKVYAVDTGLANAVGFRTGPNTGRLAENWVFLELLKRRKEAQDFEIYYWKDPQHREVDFVIKRGNRAMELIQVCWDTSQPDTKRREVASLLKGMEELKIAEATILTESEEATEEIKGKSIRFMPLWKWLR